MTPTADAFARHPELRGKITDPESSFFRDFAIERVLETHPELEWILPFLHNDETREINRQETLKNHGEEDLWVFAYGSLMWDPAFQFSEVLRAKAPNHERRFILKETLGGRGSPELPGLMAALDDGEGCDGLLFRIPAEFVETETDVLWRREYIAPSYCPSFITANAGDTEHTALTFVADHDAEYICGEITREEQISCLASGVGILGTSIEYLEKICSQFEVLGIEDEESASLLAETKTFMQQNAAANDN